MKIGRNDPCPCGSGKKYKKCCIDKERLNMEQEVALQFARLEAKRKQEEKQQGLGKSIISIEHHGIRFVAVGSRMYHSPSWKTFHDFLFDYIKMVFKKEWGTKELEKPLDERHPILKWYHAATVHMKKHKKNEGVINSTVMTGAISAYLNLSYNLYLLAHNYEEEVQAKLIKRLKNIEQFQGALYETYVASIFTLAGFKLEMEDEEDSLKSHCEFTATSKSTGEKFSVEAKARQAFKEGAGVGNQLYNALTKDAEHKRVVCIDVNVNNLLGKLEDILKELKDKETKLTIKGKPAPEAYVFVTNHSFEYDLEGWSFERMGYAYGYKIPDFNVGTTFPSIKDALIAREKHKDMESLITSIRQHSEIPITFDAEIPEFAFDEEAKAKRLLIGNRYLVPDGSGQEVEAILVDAVVAEEEKIVYGMYLLKSGRRITCTNPLTDAELIAYKRHPETFFGVPLKKTNKVNDPLELYDFFYGSYKTCPRERLLGFLKNRKDIEHLKTLSDEELLVKCCEMWVYSAMNQK